MSKNFSLKNFNIKHLSVKLVTRFSRHFIFAAVFLVLLVYLLVVIQIKSLANADVDPNQQATVVNSIPKVDEQAVKQIQSLEQNNTDVRSLFDNSRNNPFSE